MFCRTVTGSFAFWAAGEWDRSIWPKIPGWRINPAQSRNCSPTSSKELPMGENRTVTYTFTAQQEADWRRAAKAGYGAFGTGDGASGFHKIDLLSFVLR